jgi:hypothetical protein
MWKLLRNLVIVAVLCVAVLKLLLWYETQQGVARMVQRLAPIAQVSYGSVGSSLDGDVALRAVSISLGNGAVRTTWRAAQVDLATPGALWLIRRVLLDDDSLPEHLGITVRGLQMPAAALGGATDSAWLSPLSLVPFETLGCGIVSRFSIADYQRMGLNPGVRQQTLDYRYDAANSVLTFSARLDTPPFSTITLSGEVQKFAPRMLTAANWQKLHVSELSLGYADSGYLAKRNRFCAQQAGVTPAKFVDQHLSAVEAFLAGHGVQPGTQVAATYRALVAEGGRISVLSLPPAASTIGELLAEPADSMTRRLNLTARRNDAPPVMVRLDFQAAPEGESVAADATSPPPATSDEPPGPVVGPASPAKAPPPPAPVVSPAPKIATAKPAPAKATVPAAAPPARAAATTAVKPAKPEAGAHTAEAAAPNKPGDQESELASAPPPPPGSTLALVWKPTVDRLERKKPPPRDYDVIGIDALDGYVGKNVRLITKTQKEVEGRVIGIDANTVGMRIKKAGGMAELHVPRSVIVEIQVPRTHSADDTP